MKRSPPKGGWFIDLVGGYKGEGKTHTSQSCLLHPMFARWSSSLSSSSFANARPQCAGHGGVVRIQGTECLSQELV